MITSQTPTRFLLVEANTDTPYDSCDYAIIYISEHWKTEQQKRLQAVTDQIENNTFRNINFYDSTVSFYRLDDDETPDIDTLLNGSKWKFIHLEQYEQDRLMPTLSPLEYHQICIYHDGTARYEASSMGGNDYYDTAIFSLKEILQQLP